MILKAALRLLVRWGAGTSPLRQKAFCKPDESESPKHIGMYVKPLYTHINSIFLSI